jgi:hypothetical protein
VIYWTRVRSVFAFGSRLTSTLFRDVVMIYSIPAVTRRRHRVLVRMSSNGPMAFVKR